MEISMGEQTAFLLYSCVVGALLGMLYDVFRIIRVAFNSGFIAVFLQDFFYCVISSCIALVFVFYANSGQIRWYAVMGCFLFFTLYHLTVGRFVIFVSRKIIAFIKKLLHMAYLISIYPVKLLAKFLHRLILRLLRFISRRLSKLFKFISYSRQKQKSAAEAFRGYSLLEAGMKRKFKNKKILKSKGDFNEHDEKKDGEKHGKVKKVYLR